MKNQWDWKETVSGWDREKIIEDLLCDDYIDSTIFTLAKREVFQMLNKSSYKFITGDLFDEIYFVAVETTQKQILRYKNGKKSFLSENNCTFTNEQIVQKIISRITNNIRNLYDLRYKESIPRTRSPIMAHYEFSNYVYHNNYLDPLSILLNEEDIVDILISQIDTNFIKNLSID